MIRAAATYFATGLAIRSHWRRQGRVRSEDLKQREVPRAARPTGGFFDAVGGSTQGVKPMPNDTDDLRIREIRELSTPAEVMLELPRAEAAGRTVARARQAIHDILAGDDDRLVVIVGPCSVHDPAAALDYAGRLARLRNRLHDRLEIVMRVYFEKPRTTVGWKGLINDSRPRRLLPHRQGTAHRPPAAARDQPARPARRLRVPRHDHAAVFRRPGRLGRHRRAHHREPGASRARLRPLLPGRLQERHRRQRQDRGGRGAGGLASRIISSPSPRPAAPPLRLQPAMATATSSCAAARHRITTPARSRPPAAFWSTPASHRS